MSHQFVSPRVQFFTALPTILLNYTWGHGQVHRTITDCIPLFINSFISLNLNLSISSGSSQRCGARNQDANKLHSQSVNPLAGRGVGFLEKPQYLTAQFITINEVQNLKQGNKDRAEHKYKKFQNIPIMNTKNGQIKPSDNELPP